MLTSKDMKRLIIAGCVLAFVGLSLIPGMVAATEISNGYVSIVPLSNGTVVSFVAEEENSVEPGRAEATEKLLGVVVGQGERLVDINSEVSNVSVATSGTVRTLVTLEDGTIAAGDLVSVGTLSGIAAKESGQAYVLGVARQDFNAESERLGTIQELIGAAPEGVDPETPIGLIDVELNITANPSLNAGFLQGLGSYFTDRGASPVRLILAAIVFVAAIDLVGTVMFGSAKGSIISIGRNPLSSKYVYKGLIEISVASLLFLGFALAALYLLLG